MKQIKTEIPLIDSLSLRIPFSECKILDKRLLSRTLIYYPDVDDYDDIDNIMPPKPYKHSKNGISIRISITEIPIYNRITQQKVQTKFINLTVSAKLLREQYFDGINRSNIETIYKTFIDFKVFSCDFETFKNGQVNDIDICINRYISKNYYKPMLSGLLSQTGTKQKYVNLIDTVNHTAIYFSDRYSAKPSLPFYKIYDKEQELLNKSAEFYNNYLAKEYGLAIKDLTRVEATIKNYKHKQRLERFNILPAFKTLDELFNLTDIQLLVFVKFSLNSYIEHKPRVKAKNLTPTQHIIFELLQNSVIKGYSFEQILAVADTFQGNPLKPKSTDVAKTRIRKEIKYLYDLLIFKDVKLESTHYKNQHIQEYYKFLGLIT